MRIERDADYGEYVTIDHLSDYSLSFCHSDDNYTEAGLSHIDASSSEPAVLRAMPAKAGNQVTSRHWRGALSGCVRGSQQNRTKKEH